MKLKLFKKKRNLEISDHVTAIDGRVIARTGDGVEQNFLDLLQEQRPEGIENIQTIENTSLFSNFEILLQNEKYQFISDYGKRQDALLSILGSIRLNPLVIKELTWLERYAYHYHHSLVVALLAARMTLDKHQDEEKAGQAASCALIHDFGISRVPEEILTKVSPLSEEEMKFVREHPIYSYVLLIYYGYESSQLHARVGFEHHENLLGTGYPRGVIQDNEVTQFVQISDIFDALISARPFRPAMTTEQALKTIAEMVNRGELQANIFALLKACVHK